MIWDGGRDNEGCREAREKEANESQKHFEPFSFIHFHDDDFGNCESR
jgi:hypothetical protein